MPHIRVRGLPLEDLESVSDTLVETLAELTDTPNSHFTLEYQSSIYLVVGGASPAYPFIEILWFDRGAEVKAKVAQAIDDLIRPLIDAGQDITTLFRDLKGADYFENGEHF
ncbi:hypothetical protein MAQ5080_00331 [Marinomonas aquimarina]|uniref:DUF1904 domain-containing protein n=1 Tax=Marinomonas aquimarina TaxID=295068 RepID=A0A1A8T1X3_9GAMM|nr:DUF1904 family protein [Marinomonas aquimarina]SBS25676.1 hypothetical protein MAQ5080_00331 [Marinomonas aquimarina]